MNRPISAAGRGLVCSVDERASRAGVDVLQSGGSAADAAIATSAVLSVTTQHMCGLGGDLFALVHHGDAVPDCLNASGRAGSGADAAELRAEGFDAMPFRNDIRSVTVPGCVDGWLALHERHGRLPLKEVLAQASDYAVDGFVVPAHLVEASVRVSGIPGAENYQGLEAGSMLRRNSVGELLGEIATGGRDAWYGGEFGQALLDVGDGLFNGSDLATSQADWVEPISQEAWGHVLWTIPPNSQGYLSLAAAGVLQGLELGRLETAQWAHMHIEASRLAAYDRVEVLHEHADGQALLAPARLAERRARLNPTQTSALPTPASPGGTIYLCATDEQGMGVSLIQSNASGFGAHIVAPGTGVFLHNRGIGFSLEPGHPAELGPGRRPPHTLSPAIVTRHDGSLRATVGTMGGDAQPQIMLQLFSRLLVSGLEPAQVLARPRWAIEALESDGFNTWQNPNQTAVHVEPEASGWVDELVELGHIATAKRVGVGHAHIIDIDPSGNQRGGSEPRINTSAAIAASTNP
ncbi:MAG: gamma-glutamyltransferase family protein [Acidimicrobiales bacterium]